MTLTRRGNRSRFVRAVGGFLVAAVASSVALVLWLHDFLAVNAPVQAEGLVVEGWVPDYIVEEAVREFEAGRYEWVAASGGPLSVGTYITEYRTYADVGVATLEKLGLPKDKLIVAEAEKTYRNRTYYSAKGVKAKLEELGLEPNGLNVVTEGAHARRTRLVYRKVFGSEVAVGVLSYPSKDYDPDRWWASSDGVKTTITETIGWLYECLFDSGR